ncbi:sensor histidine kinase [Litchfieldia alkalitelluris]|uniref:sensor histidine kinase n=1 Tax=Litchfieldia alkalitelluris TaxID=304268 RepID=UPI000998CD9D|nr:HAMP domain-containing sensor histidine kinase [Litchfieldia alkalitelluris]
MFNKLNTIRIAIIKSHFIAAISTGILFFIGLQVILLALPNNPLTLSSILLLTGYVFVISISISIYFGYIHSQPLKKRLEDISTFITVLDRGNYKTRITDHEQDEISRIKNSLNQLAEKIENQVHSLQRLADEKTELAEKAHQAATIEGRQRLARDLHDAVSQQLFAIGMLSSAAVRLLESNSDKSKDMIKDIAELSEQAQVEMRALLLHLRPVHLGRDSLHDGINKLVEELKSKCHLEFETNLSEITSLSKGTEDHVFRIIQEALSNILRHAEATKVKLRIFQKDGYVYLHIDDNGIGFNLAEEKKTSYGLKTMKERCDEIGGLFTVQSKGGQGTYINIKVPI